MGLIELIRFIFAYFIGILYVCSVAGFFGLFFISWGLPNLFGFNDTFCLIIGIIVTIIFIIGLWILFVGEMVEDVADGF